MAGVLAGREDGADQQPASAYGQGPVHGPQRLTNIQRQGSVHRLLRGQKN